MAEIKSYHYFVTKKKLISSSLIRIKKAEKHDLLLRF